MPSLGLRMALVVLAVLLPTIPGYGAKEKVALEFSLRSHEGRVWTQKDFGDAKLIVVAFLGTECPLAKLYGRRLADLDNRFRDQGVAFIGVNANRQDSMTELSAYAERHHVTFPLLKDGSHELADLFDAERTPEIFVLDREGNVRYHGRVDDQYGVGYSREEAERKDLEVAIEELLAGKAVSVPTTDVIGCHIGRSKEIDPHGDITYSKHIAAIFQKRCLECHRDGEIAPFPLTQYEDVLGWEDTILEVIEEQRMPPWFANPAHGKFKNDARLTDQEKTLIRTWIENGMPVGNPADVPEPPQFTEGWRIDEPDQVFKMRTEPFDVPASGTVPYQHFTVDPGWTEDKYITAAEARPDNKAVVHHILVYILPNGERRPRLDYILVGYAPGSTPVELEPGVALKVPAGSKLLFQMHYTPNGYAQSDLSYAGVKFIDKKDVKQEIRGRLAINPRLRIEPHAENHRVTANYPVPYDELLVAMTPHMHLRGKSFRYTAKYPDGREEILLDVPQYDFNWQLKYILDKPKLLPAGTTIQCVAHYDNSAGNLSNPDPAELVRWGDQSYEEMMIGFFDTIPKPKTKSTASIDPSGDYSWKGNPQKREIPGSVHLELDGDTLGGYVDAMGQRLPLQEAVITGDKVTFSVSGGRFRFGFRGQVTESGIRGKISMGMGSLVVKSQDWIAKKK